jgi:hypothetical protein
MEQKRQYNRKRSRNNHNRQLAVKKRPPIKQPSVDNMEINYFNLYQSLYRKETSDWQEAREARYNPVNPLTYSLQQIYRDAMLDNHLSGAINNRILQIINKEFLLKDQSGNVDVQRSLFVQNRNFRKIIRAALESKLFGYSMLFISDFEEGKIKSVMEIPRENVIPEKGIIVQDMLNPNSNRIYFKDYPQFLIYIQLGSNSVGDLERLAPLTIYKRHSWASWDEFEQIFGVPIRIARTMINTQKHKDDLQMWLETMGTANYAILDKQTDIEIKENSKSDAYNVFLQKIEIINKEISKGILGETMTMDDGSSQSQANVHLETLNQVIAADIADIEDWVTDNFLPILRSLGYDIPEGYYFVLQEKISINPQEKIKIDAELLRNGLRLSKEYLESTYEVEFADKDIYAYRNTETLSFFQ